MFSSKKEDKNETLGSRIVDADKVKWPEPAPDIKEAEKVAEHVKMVKQYSEVYLKNYQDEATLTLEVEDLRQKLSETSNSLQAAAEARRLSAEDMKRVMSWNFNGVVTTTKSTNRF